MQSVRGTFYLFVGAHPVDAAHKDVSKYQAVDSTHRKSRRNFKSWVFLQTAQIDGDDRDVRAARFFEGTPDKSDIIAGSASAACLGNQHGDFVQVIFAGLNGLHNLSYHDQRRVAGVIIDILQADVHGLAVICFSENFQVITGSVEGRFDQVKMDRGHLRTENRITLTHFFCKDHPVDV